MLLVDGTSLHFVALPASLLLVPVALAARRKKKEKKEGPEQKKPSPTPPKRSGTSFLALALLAAVLGVVGTLAFRHASRSSLPGDSEPGGLSPSAGRPASLLLGRELGSFWTEQVARVCPRFAALMGADAGQASDLVVVTASVECMSILCEQPEQWPASTRGAMQQTCSRLLSRFRVPLEEVVAPYQEACPEVHQTWARREWSPSNHLGLFRDIRRCAEDLCERQRGQLAAKTTCATAAKLAEGFGDTQATERLLALAREAEEREQKEWDALPEEERNARMDAAMRVITTRLAAMCRQGIQRSCDSLDKYCRIEGYRPEVCQSRGSPAALDAGTP
jgi:hypothetical protein